MKAIEKMVSSVRDRYEAHVQREDECYFQKAEVVLQYAVSNFFYAATKWFSSFLHHGLG